METPIASWRRITGRRPGSAGLTSEERAIVVRGIRKLSAGFGGGRNLAGQRYLDDAALLGAYLLFFGPISERQARSALARSGVGAIEGRALDIGTGPGPVARALVALGASEVVGLDHSDAALQIAKAFVGPALAAQTWDLDRPLPRGPFRIATLGHVVNELWKREADRIARRVGFLGQIGEVLAPGGQVLVLEPATHAINREMLELRDALAAAGWRIDAPCFRQGPCPALAAGVACHADVPMRVDREHVALARAARLSKDVLAFGWILARPPSAPAKGDPPFDVRVVSERLVNKAGRERFVVCGRDGRFSLSAPGGTAEPTWRALGRGDAVRVTNPEPREGGWGVGPTTRIEVLVP